MRITLDGGKNWIEATPGVVVDIDLKNEDGTRTGSMTFAFNESELVASVWGSLELDEMCLAAQAFEYSDLSEFMLHGMKE
jgi:hypothetical protein